MNRIFAFSAVIFFSACSGNKNENTPGNILGKEKLVNLQVDLYMVESAHNMNILKKDSADSEYRKLFEMVLNKHSVTREDYEASLRYYTLDNKSMNEIYDSILVKLTKLESEAAYSKEE